MSENVGKSDQATEITSGGAETALDMQNERDRGTTREAMKKWPKRWRSITPELKDKFVAGLDEANETARKLLYGQDVDTALKAAAAVASIVRTAAMMENQHQADEHLQDKNQRLDDGKATERIAMEPIIGEEAIRPPK